MVSRCRSRWIAAGLLVLTGAAAGGYFLFFRPDPGDTRLNALVHAKPPVPVVFTSRSEPASFEAAADVGEGFHFPGQKLWAAREGRLRLLTPRGTVHELTWGKPLPDGGTLIDVMSPSVSLDGKRILFAGRKGGDDPGRFRLYEVLPDGSGLHALTGGSGDEGCVAVPPLRFAPDGTRLPDTDRRRIDYDDVDPIDLGNGSVLFASSRTPDLGRDHSRRSTTLWLLHPDGRKMPATANRNNDRWPFLMSSGYVAFSLWSRNREVVTADETDLRPHDPAVPSATRPTDNWLGAFLRISSKGHFGMLVKPPVPVWRPRSLFNGRVCFMTELALGGGLTVVQCEPGLIASAPSSLDPGTPLPAQRNVRLRRGPDRTADGRPLVLATPSPCPPGGILLSAAAEPGRFGIYLARDEWPDRDAPASAAEIDLTLLFDDPELVDAEPVAVYARGVQLPPESGAAPAPRESQVTLASGRTYHGTTGTLQATSLYAAMMNDLPGQTTDAGAVPLFAPPPNGTIDHLKIYAARRDRFDDPVRPRVPGEWELLLTLKATENAGGAIPTDTPTVLAGFGADGKIAHWTSPAADAAGRRATFYALAGDHYSLTAPGSRHFCVGCHPGHSGLPRSDHTHAERVAK